MNENNAAFLAELGKSLASQENVDSDLAEIISRNVLTVAPAEDCVEQALALITTLAAKRANPPKDNANG